MTLREFTRSLGDHRNVDSAKRAVVEAFHAGQVIRETAAEALREIGCFEAEISEALA